ncbi:DNA-binding protein HU-beta [Dysgonomonadaceae bacterium PH5-43]|nr:DNA-binding protein HU-beta [Dysgonomonadaceae bacterium PH5-43]
MNKSELVAAIAAKTGFTKVDALKALNAYVEVVGDELRKGNKVNLVGHGTYLIISKKGRKGIDPRNQQPIEIAPKRMVKFKPGKTLTIKK